MLKGDKEEDAGGIAKLVEGAKETASYFDKVVNGEITGHRRVRLTAAAIRVVCVLQILLFFVIMIFGVAALQEGESSFESLFNGVIGFGSTFLAMVGVSRKSEQMTRMFFVCQMWVLSLHTDYLYNSIILGKEQETRCSPAVADYGTSDVGACEEELRFSRSKMFMGIFGGLLCVTSCVLSLEFNDSLNDLLSQVDLDAETRNARAQRRRRANMLAENARRGSRSYRPSTAGVDEGAGGRSQRRSRASRSSMSRSHRTDFAQHLERAERAYQGYGSKEAVEDHSVRPASAPVPMPPAHDEARTRVEKDAVDNFSAVDVAAADADDDEFGYTPRGQSERRGTEPQIQVEGSLPPALRRRSSGKAVSPSRLDIAGSAQDQDNLQNPLVMTPMSALTLSPSAINVVASPASQSAASELVLPGVASPNATNPLMTPMTMTPSGVELSVMMSDVSLSEMATPAGAATTMKKRIVMDDTDDEFDDDDDDDDDGEAQEPRTPTDDVPHASSHEAVVHPAPAEEVQSREPDAVSSSILLGAAKRLSTDKGRGREKADVGEPEEYEPHTPSTGGEGDEWEGMMSCEEGGGSGAATPVPPTAKKRDLNALLMSPQYLDEDGGGSDGSGMRSPFSDGGENSGFSGVRDLSRSKGSSNRPASSSQEREKPW